MTRRNETKWLFGSSRSLSDLCSVWYPGAVLAQEKYPQNRLTSLSVTRREGLQMSAPGRWSPPPARPWAAHRGREQTGRASAVAVATLKTEKPTGTPSGFSPAGGPESAYAQGPL